MIKDLFIVLVLSVSLPLVVQADGPAQSGDAKADMSTGIKYLPYPDVWNWKIPFHDRKIQFINADILPSGDVRISYQFKRKAKRGRANALEEESHAITTLDTLLISTH